jgi:hypothetical protein
MCMPDRGQNLTLTENVGRGFILRSTLPAHWIFSQPHQLEVSAQGIMPCNKLVTTMDCTLLKDKNLTLVPRLGPDINSRACRELPRSCHRLQCWFPSQRPILFLRSCLETPKADSGRTNPVAEPFLVSRSAVSLPLTPACPGT